ncbi:ATP-binding protein [Actinacidiphila oryziradicis]|jgi:hypothetical protein|uniref:ATP-binding protein n=1 Tax=Actinacidiphila oryziradicis TaxID=2571141 RepID=UPI0023F417AF|nr:ATP-binding protein [Actinacidiphila oryziradicis]MCW2872919.1 ATP-binding protein [Actinacidiphila oryziradicis]
MSLPLSRRIARAALLVGAAAAPLIGAGAASAAALPQTTDLGGLTNLDSAGVANTLDGTTHQAGEVGGKAVKAAVPAVGKGVSTVGRTALPAAQKSAGKSAGSATETVGKLGKSVGDVSKPLSGANLPAVGQVPLKGAVPGGLPIGG